MKRVERSLIRCLILDSASREVLLVQRSETESFGAGLWELMQGSRDPGETPRVSAWREIEEELSWTPQSLPEGAELILAGDDQFSIIHKDGFEEDWCNFNYILIGQNLNKLPIELCDDHDDYKWVKLEDAILELSRDPYQAGALRMLQCLPETLDRMKVVQESLFFFLI